MINFTPTSESVTGSNNNDIVSMALNTSSATAQESINSESLVPENIRSGAAAFIKFINDYYEYINDVGLPSQQISDITTEQDIDRASGEYIDAIQKEIANIVPKTDTIDKVSLYKKIVKYYKMRGSEESIHAFFKIFFNEVVEIFYPKERLFELSTGDVNSYTNDISRLHDGDYWQRFSYEIKAPIDTSYWLDNFYGLVHPAGLKLFSSIVIQLIAENNWLGPAGKVTLEDNNYVVTEGTRLYTTDDPENDLSWIRDMFPSVVGYHTPLFQPGWLSQGLRILKLLTEIDYRPAEKEFIHTVLMVLILTHVSEENHYERTRPNYENLKFDDFGVNGDYSDIQISDAIDAQDELKKQMEFSNISSFISFQIPNAILNFSSLGTINHKIGVEVVNISTMKSRYRKNNTDINLYYNDVPATNQIGEFTKILAFNQGFDNSSDDITRTVISESYDISGNGAGGDIKFSINFANSINWGEKEEESNDHLEIHMLKTSVYNSYDTVDDVPEALWSNNSDGALLWSSNTDGSSLNRNGQWYDVTISGVTPIPTESTYVIRIKQICNGGKYNITSQDVGDEIFYGNDQILISNLTFIAS
jgi:hypothetical protein